jgi:hypothetical protein
MYIHTYWVCEHMRALKSLLSTCLYTLGVWVFKSSEIFTAHMVVHIKSMNIWKHGHVCYAHDSTCWVCEYLRTLKHLPLLLLFSSLIQYKGNILLVTFISQKQLKRSRRPGKLSLRFKISIFWDITPCSPLKVNLRFGGACRLHLQSRRIRRARYGNFGWISTDYMALYPRR